MAIDLLSLFCGAGGLDLGFTQQGFNVNLAIDSSQAAIDTHKINFLNANAQSHDLLQLGVSGLLDLCMENFKVENPIGIIGGPPCQGFSRGNIRSHKDDPRNKLAIYYMDAIREIKKIFDVKFVVFENVLGLRDKKHASTYAEIVSALADMGFDVFEKELNAIDFGVAQIRKRVILIAIQTGSYSGYPEIEFLMQKKTIKDVIYGLPEPTYFSSKLLSSEIPYHPNHWTMKPRSKRFLDPELFQNKTRSFRVVNWDKPSPTIAYGNREIYVHPDKKRRLSIHESMLLQGFPKEFILKGNLSQQVTQISNAVPPPMAMAIASSIKKVIKDLS